VARDSKRRQFRVKPDIDDLCLIDPEPSEEFNPTIGAFIVNESPLAGCGLVVREGDGLEKGMDVRIKLGKLAPLLGRIVWKKELDSELYKIGIELLE